MVRKIEVEKVILTPIDGFALYSSYFLLRSAVSEAVDKISTLESLQHNFVTLKNATENFSDDNKLGKGGFGVVYKVIEHSNIRRISPFCYE